MVSRFATPHPSGSEAREQPQSDPVGTTICPLTHVSIQLQCEKKKQTFFSFYQVQTLLQQMQDKFQTMSDQIIGRIDDMSCRIDDLEKNIADLMTQAGVEELEGENKAPATNKS
nr:PREDICTED: heat shock factor-binding protein 1 [Struthio camelus australis]